MKETLKAYIAGVLLAGLAALIALVIVLSVIRWALES